ncbi:type IV secretion system protein VirB7 [Rhizobium mongolense]|uniref:Type IV secretion system protein VirB7 n=3 Tax=Rhizobium mongolense TaxID=57676 RepID=A0ABR6IX56_9HYPH|nr:type IV secretion system protein VirB7 [Rhizobium mongolense]TVZ66680.1 type IV secretion system protein VirB7 [Rhizobium mongolense USDA 1844]
MTATHLKKWTGCLRMLRIVSLFLIAGALPACSSMTHPLPRCDGYFRRPLNRAMWQREDDGMLKQPSSAPASHAASYAEEHATPTAFTHFDVEGSYRPCKGK